MRKKTTAFLLVLILLLPLLHAGEGETFRHFSYTTGIFTSDYEMQWDKGQVEYSLGIRSTFPNTATIMLLDQGIGGYLTPLSGFEDIVSSLIILNGVEGSVSYDLLKTSRLDLDLGVDAIALFCPVFHPDYILGMLLEGSTRLSFNFRNGNSFFLKTRVPLLGAFAFLGPEKALGYAATASTDPDSALILGLYTGLTLGARFPL